MPPGWRHVKGIGRRLGWEGIGEESVTADSIAGVAVQVLADKISTLRQEETPRWMAAR